MHAPTRLRCLTWNILAQKYLRDYPWMKSNSLAWDKRRKQIIEIAQDSSYDIIFMQEVDLESIEADFAESFKAYSIIPHAVTKRTIGNMTLLKKDLFEVNKIIHSSTGIHLVIIHIPSSTKLWVSNLHLKAGFHSGEGKRVEQLSSTIRRWKSHDSLPGLIVGDLNDNFDPERKLYPILNDNGFNITLGPPSCYVGYQFWRFDHAFGNTFVIKYDDSPLLKPIPNEENPSDHNPVPFDVTI